VTAGDDPKIGTVLGERYRIQERLAAGGMGVVYHGTRIGLERRVAIKFLHAWASASGDALKRFENEARAMSRLSHPHCVSVIDFGFDEAPYLVMDYVTGPTLRKVMDDVRLPVARTLHIFRQVLAGLAHAHGHGIVHRDIKPDNIVLSDAEGVPDHVRILDFGLAKLADAGGDLTAGFAIGTPSYMSPEQASGGKVDPRTDVYTAGILLHEMLAGQKPFAAKEAIAVLAMHRNTPPKPLRQVVPEAGFSSALEAVVLRALAKRPEDRFAGVAEMARALDLTPEARPAEARRTRLWPIAVVGTLLLGGVAAAAVMFSRGPTEPTEAAPLPIPGSAPTSDEEIGITVEPDAEIPGLDEVRAKLAAGRRDTAIKELQELRKRHPDRAVLPFLEGHAQTGKMWWTEALACFRAAITIDPSYRQNTSLIRDVISALQSDKAHARAAAFLRDEIGAAAVPLLEEAAQKHAAIAVRRRAASLAASIAPK
jgi:eukaryotic-like serine/threonine-protein kinase